VVKTAEACAEGFHKLGGGGGGGGAEGTSEELLYAERWVPFEKELAVMVVKSACESVQYPVVETTQKDSICHTVRNLSNNHSFLFASSNLLHLLSETEQIQQTKLFPQFFFFSLFPSFHLLHR
jgi:hypothetical protein